MSEAPTVAETPPKAKSPLRTRQEILGYFYGQPLESFEKLLEVQPAAQPTDLDIIRHWIYIEDSLLENKYRTTKSNSAVSRPFGSKLFAYEDV